MEPGGVLPVGAGSLSEALAQGTIEIDDGSQTAETGARPSETPTAPAVFDASGLRRAFATCRAAETWPVRGDFDLNPDLEPPQRLIEAAVLVPLVLHDGGLTVLLTQRTKTLTRHAGQISFPGGRLEPGDDSALDCALRETQEEVGIAPTQVEVIGRLDTYVVRTGYRVTPFVGLLNPPLTLNLHAIEVAEAFEVPLDFVLDPSQPLRHSVHFEGRDRYFYVFPYRQRYIWGATAGMLRNLKELLAQSC